MEHLGDPRFVKEGVGKRQLVLSDPRDRPDQSYTVHTDLIGQPSVERATTGTAVLQVRLKTEGHRLRIPEMHFAQLWEEPEPGMRYCRGTFRVDYWDSRFDEQTSEIEIHGRGPLGVLVDRPLRTQFSGELATLVSSLCRESAPTEIQGIGSRTVSIFSNTDSTYATLRLLAISLGFVIKEHPTDFAILVRDLAIERSEIESKPIVHLNETNTLGGSLTRGAPVKRRT